jgi:hypothetical protein
MPEGHPDRIAAAVSEVLRRTASSRAVTPCEQPEFERDRLPLIHPGDECEHLRDIDRLARPRAEACEECGMERIGATSRQRPGRCSAFAVRPACSSSILIRSIASGSHRR